MYNVAIRRFCDLQRDLPSKSRTHPSPYIIIAMDVLCFCGNFPGKNNSIPTATGSLSCLHIRTEQHNLCNKGTATQKGWTRRASLNSRHEFMSPGAAKISPRVLEEGKYIVRDLPLVIFFLKSRTTREGPENGWYENVTGFEKGWTPETTD